MIEILKAILFGIVEGITEWLPISSTGHMIILDEFVKLDCTPEFKEMFLVVIQLGAILAVVLLFWNKIFPFQFKDKSKPVIEMDKIMLWCKIVVACIPAAVIGSAEKGIARVIRHGEETAGYLERPRADELTRIG